MMEKYILSIAPILLDEPVSTLANAVATQREKIQSFSLEGAPVLVLTKVVSEDATEAADVRFSLEVVYMTARATGMVVIKRKPEPLDPERSVASQVQVQNFADQSPFDTVHTFLHNSFAPYLRSFLSKEHGEKRLQGGLAVLDQKITELELSLYNCKQDAQVDNVVLAINPEIKAAAIRCKEKGEPLVPQALGNLVESDAFLNKLQAGVIAWGKQIESVRGRGCGCLGTPP